MIEEELRFLKKFDREINDYDVKFLIFIIFYVKFVCTTFNFYDYFYHFNSF